MNDARIARPTLLIDLGALRRNWLTVLKRSAPAECAAVLKADGYGLGAARLATTLSRAGCRTFFVATTEEGVSLRASAPEDAEIFILNGVYDADFAALLQHKLIPVLSSCSHVSRWMRNAPAAACALQIDTGMNRLGLDTREMGRLLNCDVRTLRPVLLMSHLACADEAGHPQNAAQRRLFATMALDALQTWPEMRISLANSSEIFLGRGRRFDLTRPGIALYGANPAPGRENPMHTVATVLAPILRIITLPDGGPVGYGADYVAKPGTRLAVVGVGYADGYLRSLSGKGCAWINGAIAPVAGRVSMDLTVFDVTAVDHVAEGDMAELIGPNIDIDRLADAAGTIAYELLAGLGRRLVRRYIDDDTPSIGDVIAPPAM